MTRTPRPVNSATEERDDTDDESDSSEEEEEIEKMSPQQIDKIPDFSGEKDHFGDRTCTICMEPLKEGEKIKLLKCGHLFHTTCIRKWLS